MYLQHKCGHLSSLFCPFLKTSLTSPAWPQTQNAPSQPPEGWDYRHRPLIWLIRILWWVCVMCVNGGHKATVGVTLHEPFRQHALTYTERGSCYPATLQLGWLASQ